MKGRREFITVCFGKPMPIFRGRGNFSIFWVSAIVYGATSCFESQENAGYSGGLRLLHQQHCHDPPRRVCRYLYNPNWYVVIAFWRRLFGSKFIDKIFEVFYEKCIFHVPNYINPNRKSGSQIRPMKMYYAFQELGYDVDVVMGYGKTTSSNSDD